MAWDDNPADVLAKIVELSGLRWTPTEISLHLQVSSQMLIRIILALADEMEARK